MGWSSVVAAVAAAAGRGGSAGEAQRRRDECSNGMDAGGRRDPNHDARLSDHSARIAASACARPQAIPAKPENVHRTTAIGPSDGRESREFPMTRPFVVQDVGGSYRQGRHRAPSFPSPSCRRLLVGGNYRQGRHPADPIRTVSTWPGRGLDVQRHADGAHAGGGASRPLRWIAPVDVQRCADGAHAVVRPPIAPDTDRFNVAGAQPRRSALRRRRPRGTAASRPLRRIAPVDVQRCADGAHAVVRPPIVTRSIGSPRAVFASPRFPQRRWNSQVRG